MLFKLTYSKEEYFIWNKQAETSHPTVNQLQKPLLNLELLSRSVQLTTTFLVVNDHSNYSIRMQLVEGNSEQN